MKGAQRDRLRILESLVDGPIPIVKMIKMAGRTPRRKWKWALHDLEYEGKIKRDFDGNYTLP